jgi:arylformamidase
MLLYDVTLPVSETTVHWPGDPPVSRRPLLSIARGDGANITEITTVSHAGTHIDAPLHLLADGASLDEVRLEALIGPADVSYVPDVAIITPTELGALALPADCRRLLLRTSNSDRGLLTQGIFAPDFVALSPEAGEWLAARGLWLVGIDAPSIDPLAAEDLPAHRALLSRGVVIVESVDLRAVRAGRYELWCLPLKLEGGDGAPARVVLAAR